MCIIDLINRYEGFVMVLLTAIYVIATVFILISNKKSVSVAAKANKQQYYLELLDKRLAAYFCLENWKAIAYALTIPAPPGCTSVGLFKMLLHNNPEHESLYKISKQMEAIDLRIQDVETTDIEREQLNDTIVNLDVELTSKKFVVLKEKAAIINQIEFLFPDADFEKIKQFANSFLSAAMEFTPDKTEHLKIVTEEIIENKVLESLWETLKTIDVE